MNFPAVAKQTYDRLCKNTLFSSITDLVIEHLKKISSSPEKARFVHNMVDEYNKEVFTHPLIKELVPCKKGCSACCHTQVAVTTDEANLLVERIIEGVKIDFDLLLKHVKVGNDSKEFYQLPYEDRKCIFLDGASGTCSVYNDRPSVCRTNAVVGNASQCSAPLGVEEVQVLRLLKTEQSDMAIMGLFLTSNENGTIGHLIGKILDKIPRSSFIKAPKKYKKSISIEKDF